VGAPKERVHKGFSRAMGQLRGGRGDLGNPGESEKEPIFRKKTEEKEEEGEVPTHINYKA